VDELSGLVMNIVIPHVVKDTNLPVFVYVHGGSLLYGGANLPIFDSVNLVSHSISIGHPMICVNFNYRVGIGGFLAGEVVGRSLKQDGHQGSGNFGFTDQQVAFEWVQKYIGFLGGDTHNVTAVGESAGGISISNQLQSARPPIFHRAVCMSGLSAAIPPWTMSQHDCFFETVCVYFRIDPAAPDALDKLRSIPQQELANATPEIQGVPSGTGNPCMDGWFYLPDVDPRKVNPPPRWLKGLMFGDTYHEGIIFHLNLLLLEENYHSIRETLQSKIADEAQTDLILGAYGITADLSQKELFSRAEHMCGDAIFKIPNYLLANKCAAENLLGDAFFLYHFDQRSRLPNALEGTAYHAHELLYLFGNLDNEMSEKEVAMARKFAAAWIRFANGLAPWHVHGERKWMVWGQDSKMELMTEDEDEQVRNYTRMKMMLELEDGGGKIWERWLAGVDALVNKRSHLFGK
jgi:carboxylesterase type B